MILVQNRVKTCSSKNCKEKYFAKGFCRHHYEQSPERKAYLKKYHSKPENKAKAKERASRPENMAERKERDSKPEYKAKAKERQQNARLKVLQYYSKHLSKSDIPCCRCCGEKSHIGFLALDHIAGRKEMDSEPELVKLGYSSSLVKTALLNWIIKNNFPDGFQILCHNCNYAKGIVRNKNKCPHKK